MSQKRNDINVQIIVCDEKEFIADEWDTFVG